MRPSLSALRAWLAEQKLDAFILPRGDQYLGEYVAPHDETLAWLSGFTGSAGFTIVTQNHAWLYTDGRYQVQAAQELKNSGFELRHSVKNKWIDDLIGALPSGTLAFDPWLHSIDWHRQAKKKFAHHPLQLKPLTQSPIDVLWRERPSAPMAAAYHHSLEFAGESSADKCTRLGRELAAAQLEGEFINDPTLVAWLLNIRGNDVPHIPIVHARALLHATGAVELFIDPRKSPPEIEPHIVARAPDEISQALSVLKGKTLRLPPTITPFALAHLASNANVETDYENSIVIPARAQKNTTEQEGMRRAHQKDAKAFAKFFTELPKQIAKGTTEAEIAELIASCRAEQNNYVEESFPAIIGWQGNGAIVHYRPDEKHSAKISGNGILLMDSGGQYRDGTTDITRTIVIGSPTARQKEIYTRVLKGHLAIARAEFPVGTTGSQLDVLARQYLWEAGLDYDHGTGHGVGSFLSVHEGPQSISNRPNTHALQPGMVLSNEPGCYLENEFGVRIENLVMVVPSAQAGFLCFENLTFVPYDEKLIDTHLLLPIEREQITAYHAKVRQIAQ